MRVLPVTALAGGVHPVRGSALAERVTGCIFVCKACVGVCLLLLFFVLLLLLLLLVLLLLLLVLSGCVYIIAEAISCK